MAAVRDESRGQGHRASYILERGVWCATCRVCGWRTSDPQRRQAATLFRLHIQQSRVIDLDALAKASRPATADGGDVVACGA